MPKVVFLSGESWRELTDAVSGVVRASMLDFSEVQGISPESVSAQIAEGDLAILVLGESQSEGVAAEYIHRLASQTSGLVVVELFDHHLNIGQHSVRVIRTHERDRRSLLGLVTGISQALHDWVTGDRAEPTVQSFWFPEAFVSNTIESKELLTVTAGHIIEARSQVRDVFHAFGNSTDKRTTSVVLPIQDSQIRVIETSGTGSRHLEIRNRHDSERDVSYLACFNPALEPGEKFRYVRQLAFQNWFPLVHSDLQDAASQDGFPAEFLVDGEAWYGDSWRIVYQFGRIEMRFRFPGWVKVNQTRISAYTAGGSLAVTENSRLSIGSKPILTRSADGQWQDLVAVVENPAMFHKYFLLYQLAP